MRTWILMGALALAACSQSAPGGGAVAADAPPPGAEDTILAWARATYNDPANRTGLIEPVTSFYGDYNGDGASDALAFAYFDMGGSGAGLGVALFRNEGGALVFQRMVDDVFGMEPRDAHFAPGRITVTTLMPGPNDPHCCPTQPKEWTIDTN